MIALYVVIGICCLITLLKATKWLLKLAWDLAPAIVLLSLSVALFILVDVLDKEAHEDNAQTAQDQSGPSEGGAHR